MKSKDRFVGATLNEELYARFRAAKDFRNTIAPMTQTEAVRFLITLGLQEVEKWMKKCMKKPKGD